MSVEQTKVSELEESIASAAAHHVDLGRLAVRVCSVPGLPLVSARVILRAGVMAEAIPGLSLVTGRMLAEGTKRRDWRQLAVDLEDRGMYPQAFGTAESLGVSLDAMSWDWGVALDSLAEMVLEPAFDEDRLAFTKRQVAAELASLLDQPDVRTGRAFLEQLYHPHPLGRPLQGTEGSLQAIRPEDCFDLHRRALGWGGCLTVAGDVDEDEVIAVLGEAFEGRPVVETWPEVPPILGLPETRREVAAGESEQCHLFLGHLTVPRRHPDFLALEVAGIVLGSGGDLAGRIPRRLREQEGLAYHAGAGTVSGAGSVAGRFQIYVGTGPRRVAKAEQSAREEIERLVDRGLEPGELEEARSFLLGREPFRRETLRQRADAMAVAQIYGIPIDRPGWREAQIEALTKDDVESAVRRWIRPDLLRVTVGVPK
ncbi:MAG: insulinase family protein [Thermoanaerobaculia bacterium]|nr:insulinase family protein [Thermoanaerobaculia bacterium]